MARVNDSSLIDAFLDARHEELSASSFDELVTELDDLWEVVASINVEDREGKATRFECFDRKMQEDCGILASTKEEYWSLALSNNFAKDEDGMGLKQVKMINRLIYHFLGGHLETFFGDPSPWKRRCLRWTEV
jgi:hypothetical protein